MTIATSPPVIRAGLGARLVELISIDYRSLAAMRVILGVTTTYILIVLFPDVPLFLSDEGFLTRARLMEELPLNRFSLYLFNGGVPYAYLLWSINFLAALCFLIGFRSRLAAFLCWVLYTSFVARNPGVTQGGDALVSLLLFWSIFLPVGRVFSVDAALSDIDAPRDDADKRICSIATVGLLLQVVYVYVFGALLKTDDVWIRDFTAVYYAMSLETFSTGFAEWFRQYLGATILLTAFVFWLELLAPGFLFFPDRTMTVRMVCLGLLMCMHIGFRFFIRIGHFWMASLASLCTFIPTVAWDWLCARYWRAEQRRIEIYYDRDCGFCRKIALVLREFCLPSGVPVLPAQDIPEIGAVLEREVSWVLIDHTGRQRLHWDAFAYAMCQSWITLPFGLLARAYGAIGLGRPTYDLIGRNRRSLSAATRVLVPESPDGWHLGAPVRVFLVAVIAFSFAWNVDETRTAGGQTLVIGKDIANPGIFLGLHQRWSMFAPLPSTKDGYVVIDATTEDGERLDLAGRTRQAYSDDRPADLSSHFPSYRWRKYLNNTMLSHPDVRALELGKFAGTVCLRFNRGRPADQQVVSMDVYAHIRTTLPNLSSVWEKFKIGAWSCA